MQHLYRGRTMGYVRRFGRAFWSKYFFILQIKVIVAGLALLQRSVLLLQGVGETGFVTIVLDQAFSTLSWAFLIFPILWITNRFSIGSERRLWTAGIVLVLGIALTLAQAIMHLFFMASVPILYGNVNVQTFSDLMLRAARLNHIWRILSYGILVAASYGYDYYGLAIKRERKAAQLQSQLAVAQLHALKMQLHPHFLFNTLHAILVLIKQDPEIAALMITNLSEFLREMLKDCHHQEVPLWKELEFLEKYFQIEKVRFRDRLSVVMNIASGTTEASVPNLILQPLVENAIRHGISKRSGPGIIEISSQRDDTHLLLIVRDNGYGLAKEEGIGVEEGIGLANTQARLSQIYGKEHRMELLDDPEGGLAVCLVIPFKSTRIHQSQSISH